MMRAESRGAIFETPDHLRGTDIPGNAGDKDMTDALVKDGLYRVSGVGARDYGPEGLPLGHGVFLSG
jgi:hypothetical protein